MKLNICSQELFSSNASNPSFRDENKDPFLPDLQKYSLSKLCLREHCYYLSLPAPHHQCLVRLGVKSASCSRRGRWGKKGDKGSSREKTWSEFGLPVEQVPKTAFVVIREEVIMTLKSLRNKFSLKPLSSPMIFPKPHSCIILVL